MQHVLKRLLYVSKEEGGGEELNPGEFLVSKQTQKLHIFPPYGSSYISLNVDDRYDWEKHPRGSESVAVDTAIGTGYLHIVRLAIFNVNLF